MEPTILQHRSGVRLRDRVSSGGFSRQTRSPKSNARSNSGAPKKSSVAGLRSSCAAQKKRGDRRQHFSDAVSSRSLKCSRWRYGRTRATASQLQADVRHFRELLSAAQPTASPAACTCSPCGRLADHTCRAPGNGSALQAETHEGSAPASRQAARDRRRWRRQGPAMRHAALS